MKVETLPVASSVAAPLGSRPRPICSRGEAPRPRGGRPGGRRGPQWGHVRFFSPWRYNVDAAAAALLERLAGRSPIPIGSDRAGSSSSRYLEPLAAPRDRSRIRLDTRVLSVTRDGFDKMKTPVGKTRHSWCRSHAGGRGKRSWLVPSSMPQARSVPNPVGASGKPAIGEPALRGPRSLYGIPDVLGSAAQSLRRATRAGGRKRSLGIQRADRPRGPRRRGAGHRITWAVRRPESEAPVRRRHQRCVARPRRTRGTRRRLVEDGRLRLVTGFGSCGSTQTGDGIVASDEAGWRARRSTRSSRRPGSGPTSSCSPNCGLGSIPPWRPECARPPDRSQPAQLRVRATARRGGAAPSRIRFLHRRHEELRARSDLPDADRLRAGPLGGVRHGWRMGCARVVELVLPETGVCSAEPRTPGSWPAPRPVPARHAAAARRLRTWMPAVPRTRRRRRSGRTAVAARRSTRSKSRPRGRRGAGGGPERGRIGRAAADSRGARRSAGTNPAAAGSDAAPRGDRGRYPAERYGWVIVATLSVTRR